MTRPQVIRSLRAAFSLSLALAAYPAAAQMTVVHEFNPADPADADLAGSGSGLVRANDGNLYGAARGGGAHGNGAVFRFTTGGVFTLAHSFAADGSEGHTPNVPLGLGPGGDLYGSTGNGSGGANNMGVFYRITTSGTFTKIHDNTLDDPIATSQLMLASDGNLYGTSGAGPGTTSNGSVFELDTDGTVTPRCLFTGSGGTPYELMDGLVEAGGVLYGHALVGGAHNLGAVIQFDPASGCQVQHDFADGEGYVPHGSLAAGLDGSIYGTMLESNGVGGIAYGGTIYRIVPGVGGFFSSLLDLRTTIATNGCGPSGLMRASDGNFYGIATSCGNSNAGGVFQLTPSGSYTPYLFPEPGTGVGYMPDGVLAEADDGHIYGTAQGGQYYGGVIFKMALPPSVQSILPTSGPASGGTALTLVGTTYRTGATVLVGGLPATSVQVQTDTGITADTPAGLSPGTLNDVTVTNTDAGYGSLRKGFFADFLDVPQADIFHLYVEILIRRGVTAGCGGGFYCRNDAVKRKQMAVFLLKSKLGATHVPPPATGTVFTDVPASDPFAAWIEELASLNITGGCGGGAFCPDSPVRRDQMAVFLLKTKNGSGYVPPACAGIFADVPCSPSPAFAVDWIEELYNESITAGCVASPLQYCPLSSVLRGQMAAFLVKMFFPT